jgi:DNA-binding response OmpR family regulator
MENGSTRAEKVDIVLVEDRSGDTTQILNTLKKANICNRVHVLRQAEQILDFLFRTGSFSDQPPLPAETLIMLSLNLEGVQGLDVLRKIKADARSRSFPVIILASSQEQRGVMESYKLGANACIVKPLELAKFVEAVTELRLGWLLISPEENGTKSS